MSNPNDPHLPRPEFRAGLEQEIQRAWRRESHLAQAPAPRRWYQFPALARVGVALAIGLMAGAAPAQVQESQQRRSLLEVAQMDLRLAQMRLQMVLEEVENTRRQVSVGVTGREALVSAEAKLETARAQLRAAVLNIEEIQRSAALPRDDLGAPMVGGRDFVRERLLSQVAVADRERLVARQAMEQVARRQQAGLATELEVHASRAELERSELEVQLLGEQVALRDRAARERLVGTEVEQEAQALKLRFGIESVRAQQQLARHRLAQLAERQASGAAGRSELLRAELVVLELEAELSRLQRELRGLERRPPDPS